MSETMEQPEALQFFTAAMRAVVPDFSGLPPGIEEKGLSGKRPFKTGVQVWDWIAGSGPLAEELVAHVTAEQKGLVQDVLDGMLRELREKRLAGGQLLLGE